VRGLGDVEAAARSLQQPCVDRRAQQSARPCRQAQPGAQLVPKWFMGPRHVGGQVMRLFDTPGRTAQALLQHMAPTKTPPAA